MAATEFKRSQSSRRISDRGSNTKYIVIGLQAPYKYKYTDYGLG
ncbi:hypothetical protein [Nostoc sp. DSM 114161]